MPAASSKLRRAVMRSRLESPTRQIVRENIRGRRRMLGLSQEDLARLVRVTQNTISRYEVPDDDSFPVPYMLDALAAALGVSVADLFTPRKFAEGLSLRVPHAPYDSPADRRR
jgi:transcriptional regulator with XRE-family HTH domain